MSYSMYGDKICIRRRSGWRDDGLTAHKILTYQKVVCFSCGTISESGYSPTLLTLGMGGGGCGWRKCGECVFFNNVLVTRLM